MASGNISYKDTKSAGDIEEEVLTCGSVENEEEMEIDTLLVTKSKPFDLAFVDGFNNRIGLRYYENKLKESCLVYAMSNVIVIYKLELSTTKNNVGHEMKITDIQIDKNSKIMMSSDIESIFLWDLQNSEKVEPVILRIIHKPFGDKVNILIAGLSRCGKYLLISSEKVHSIEPNKFSDDSTDVITVSNYTLQFWEWSYGEDECDDSLNLPTNYGHLCHIRFSCNINEEKFFAITFSKMVFFGTVLYHKKKMNLFYPKCYIAHKITETQYVENSRLVVSCCKKGIVIVWNDNPICEEVDNIDDKKFINKCLYEKNVYKTLTFSEVDINDIKIFNNYIVTTDTNGDTKFYDYDLLLLHIYKANEDKPQSILSVCPGAKLSKDRSTTGNWPKDLSRYHNIFRVQDFFLVNANGEVYSCDLQKSGFQKLPFSSSFRVYAEAFYTKPWLILCLENGTVQVINYNNKRIMAYFNILEHMPDDPKSIINFCALSETENFAGVGLRNGNLWILDPFTCQPTHKIKIKLKNVITNIIFGPNQLCAVGDSKYSLHVLKYIDGEWCRLSKLRFHTDRIINIFFFRHDDENFIVSISADRFYNKFIIDNSDNIKNAIQKRLEQQPKITAANIINANLLSIDIDGDIILTANDLYKFVFYNAYTAEKLYTFLGPVFDSPIQKIKYVGKTEDDPNSYCVVSSKKTLGVILLPMDGNPYRYSGVLAHHSYIYRIKLSCEGKYVILFGQGDSGGYFWSLNKTAILKNVECGGEDLEPFCRLLPGGKNGWLFKEMQDYFYYFQILANSFDGSEKTQITEFIKISDIPDYMRALGFFPSEFEVTDLIGEVTRTKYAWQQRPKKISFMDLVKLYINHKPLDGYNIDDMLNAIKIVSVTAARFVVLDTAEIELKLDHLISILTLRGENISEIQAMKYVIDLLKPQGAVASTKRCEAEITDDEVIEEFKSLGDISFSAVDFCQRLLGLNVIRDSADDTVRLTTDERIDPALIYPKLENRASRVEEESDEDNQIG